MRLPYMPDPPSFTNVEDQAVLERTQARRHPNPLIALDLTLLHSTPVTDGWNSFIGAIRNRTSLPADIREIAICRVAVLNEAWFEWASHSPLARAGGVSEAGIATLGTKKSLLSATKLDGLNEKQAAVVRYADSMTVNVKVSDPVFEALKTVGFSDRDIVEITATVAAYNCVSRFLVALDVGEHNAKSGPEETVDMPS